MPARGVSFPGCIFPVLRFLGVLSALFPCAPIIHAQSSPLPSPQAAAKASQDSFRKAVARAGLIFEGTVTAIHAESGTYRVSMQVKQGVRGVRTGDEITIREWAGLWTGAPANENRYRVGERALFCLYPLGRSGLPSTVGGRAGKLPVTGGKVALPPDWPELAAQADMAATSPTLAASGHWVRVPVQWLMQLIEQMGVTSSGGEKQ